MDMDAGRTITPWVVGAFRESKAHDRPETEPASTAYDLPGQPGMKRRPFRQMLVAALAAVPLVLSSSAGAAPTPPPGFIDTLVASGLDRPTAMAFDPGGRLFVTLQDGGLRVIRDGKLLPAPFVSLTVDSVGERGLLGVAFDPNFNSNHYVYVYYTVPGSGSPSHNRLSRFTAQRDVAAPGSELVLFELPDLSTVATNHNGGAIHFGRDGKLYVAVGDNNRSGPEGSQKRDGLFGKMLRLNRDGTIPTDNPFYDTNTGDNRAVWAWGLRNPFTFAVQPGTGRIFINDVGQHKWEEIDEGVAGSNYGWPLSEGATTDPRFRSPLYSYPHGENDTPPCAITGGTFYNPPVAYFPAGYVGDYFFADFCSGWISVYDPAEDPADGTAPVFETGLGHPVDLQVGKDGSLYYLDRELHAVRRISFEGSPTVSSFAPASGVAGQTVVKLIGTYLAGTSSVTFNGKPADFTVLSDTSLLATVPKGATTGPIAITTGAGTATTGGDFTVTLTITALAPAGGPVGTTVNIFGNGFTGTTAVKFNNKPAVFSFLSDTSIQATVPAGATTGPVIVTAAGKTTRSEGVFTVG
jgi:glucose/arabinose dehydrogenase